MPPQRPVIINPSQRTMSEHVFGEGHTSPSVFDSGTEQVAKKVMSALGMDDPPDESSAVSAGADFANPLGAVIGRATRLAPRVIRTLSGQTIPRADVMGSLAPRFIRTLSGDMVPSGIRAYHGSPYPPFDRLDVNRIGTGEGRQAFGHGLYMAGNPRVGRTYQRALSSRKLQDKVYDVEDWDGLDPIELENMWDEVYRAVSPQEREFLQALRQDGLLGFDTIEEAVKESLRPGAAGRYDLSPETLRTRQNLGSLAELNLNVRPEELLNLDRRVGEQTPYVQAAIERARRAVPAQRYYGDPYPIPRAMPLDRTLLEIIRQRGNSPQAVFGSTPEVISRNLREAGIPGSTYLDQPSRKAGEGTRNTVMFGDEKIDIVKQLMLLLGIGAPAAAGAMQQEQEPRRPSMGSIR